MRLRRRRALNPRRALGISRLRRAMGPPLVAVFCPRPERRLSTIAGGDCPAHRPVGLSYARSMPKTFAFGSVSNVLVAVFSERHPTDGEWAQYLEFLRKTYP